MTWFNYGGLIIIAVMMIPNIVFAVKHKGGYQNTYQNQVAQILEQISRYACMVLMIFNIPYTWIGFYFSFAEIIYCLINSLLVLGYCVIWVVLWQKAGIVKALLLSIIPSLIFLFSGIMIASIPLTIFAIIFTVTHVLISVKNAIPMATSVKMNKKSIITITSVILSFVMAVVCCFGGIAIYGQSSFAKLDSMSALAMINYDCTNKNNKISIAVIEDGNITYHVYGSAGKETTIYDYEIGSISKTLVGLLCAKAVNEGKLTLTDSIAQYLDLDDTKYYPTVERLLTHTSGYKAYYFESSMIGNKFAHITNDFYGISRTQILHKVKSVALENKDYPFVYSNFGIAVVGLVLEKIYNGTFTAIMNDFMRSELNLTNTQVAKQSGNLDKYWQWQENDGYLPAGAIISNVQDMANYMKIYMTDSLDYSANTFAKLKVINANKATYERLNIRMDAVGMTWLLDDKNDVVWHNGATTAFNTYLGFTQDRKKGVVILSNLSPNDKISMTVIGAKILTGDNSLN